MSHSEPLSIANPAGRFFGGIKLRHYKRLAIGDTLEHAGIPPQLVLPLRQHAGASAEPLVTVGAQVRKGELIARSPDASGAHLHAPTSGTVLALEPRPIVHRSNLDSPCIVLDCDGEDRAIEWQADQWLALAPEQLVQRIQDAGIVGLGGAVFPTHRKLIDSSVELLLINGAECEPYIACDENLMRHRSAEFLQGCQILAHTVGAARTVVAVEDQMGVTEHVLRMSCQELEIDSLDIVKVPTIYPEGGEKQLIFALTGREVPSRGIPLDLGIVCVNVGTAKAVFDAMVIGQPLISRVVSVTGRGVQQPLTVEALIGTPLSYLVELAGGYTDDVSGVVLGGPMMGIAVASDDRPLTKAGNCVLALTQADTARVYPELPCIRCMDCVAVCPAQLLPQQLLWHIKADDLDQAEAYALDDCIECGCCAYVCPSQIPLVDYYRYGKGALAESRHKREQAEHARRRFEEREQRLAKQAATRKQRLDARQLDTQPDERQQQVQAAIERSRKAKQQRDQS